MCEQFVGADLQVGPEEKVVEADLQVGLEENA
jgi:hypothetical protein